MDHRHCSAKGRKKTPVTVIIPVWNSGKWLPACLECLRCQSFTDFSLLLVDNGSTDGSVEMVRQRNEEWIGIISFPVNRGFAAAVNAGINATSSPFIALLNVDVVVEPRWLEVLVRVMEHSPDHVGALASGMLSMDDPSLVDDAGDLLSWYGSARKRGHGRPFSEYNRQEEVFSVCAGAALYRRKFFADTGLFDEQFDSYLEDIDLCLRGRLLGYRYVYVPEARVLHKGHGSGISGNRYVFLVTRNRLLVMLKNIPLRLLVRHIHHILYGQVYFFLLYRRPLASLRGYLSFFGKLFHVYQSRKNLLKKLPRPESLDDSLLDTDLGEPTLGELFRNKVCR